jgi:hypothetical protein
LPRAAVDLDDPTLGDEKYRNAEQNEIHQRKIPKGARWTDKSAEAERLDDRHRHEEQQKRDTETKERRKAGAVPKQAKFLWGLFYNMKTQAIADRFELDWVADHGWENGYGQSAERDLLVFLFPIKVSKTVFS